MMLQRFKMRLVVRREEADGHCGPEFEVKHNCTATSGVDARRDAIETAFYNHCLVSYFSAIKAEVLP